MICSLIVLRKDGFVTCVATVFFIFFGLEFLILDKNLKYCCFYVTLTNEAS